MTAPVVGTTSKPVAALAKVRRRVTFVLDSAQFGGAETYVVRLVEHLPEDYESTLVVVEPVLEQLAHTAERMHVQLIPVERVDTKFDLTRLARQARAVVSTKPDLVHVNLATATHSRHLLRVLALTKTPSIVTLHSVASIQPGLQRSALRATYRRLAGAIAVSEVTARQLREELGVDRRAVHVIRNGVERRERQSAKSSAIIRIGTLGRLSREKGLDVLVEAAKRSSLEREAIFAIAGDGPELESLQRQAAGLPVVFKGRADVSSFLANLDVFCLPSRAEALPFALLEAMMAGLPCVATAVGDVPDALGPAGVLVPPEDPDALAAALRELTRDEGRRKALGEAAHARAIERYSLDRMVAETVAVYEEVLGAQRRRP